MIDLHERTQRDIERSITHPDLDYELYRASQYKYQRDPKTGLVYPAYRRSLGSLFTGIPMELLYHDNGIAGNAKTFAAATEQVLNGPEMGQQASVPVGFWMPGAGSIGKAIRVVARGVYVTVAAVTETFTTRLGAVNVITGSIVGASGAIAGQNNIGTLAWEEELDFALQSYGTSVGANSSVRGLGRVTLGLTASNITTTSGLMTGNAAGHATGIVATVDIQVNNYVCVDVSISGTSASNTMTLLQLYLFGMG